MYFDPHTSKSLLHNPIDMYIVTNKVEDEEFESTTAQYHTWVMNKFADIW